MWFDWFFYDCAVDIPRQFRKCLFRTVMLILNCFVLGWEVFYRVYYTYTSVRWYIISYMAHYYTIQRHQELKEKKMFSLRLLLRSVFWPKIIIWFSCSFPTVFNCHWSASLSTLTLNQYHTIGIWIIQLCSSISSNVLW